MESETHIWQGLKVSYSQFCLRDTWLKHLAGLISDSFICLNCAKTVTKLSSHYPSLSLLGLLPCYVQKWAAIMICCTVGCTKRFDKDNKKHKFYRIPSNHICFKANKRRHWLQIIRRSDWNKQIIKDATNHRDYFKSGNEHRWFYKHL